MNMKKDIVNTNSESVQKDVGKSQKESSILVISRELIAGFIWLFLFVKLFIYDIDVFLLSQINPSWVVILDYRFFILLGVISVTWLIIGNKHFFKLISVIAFFPFILVLWRIPKLFWKSKSWIGVFASLGIIITIFKSIKINFILFSFVAIAIFIISTTTIDFLLVFSMVVLTLYLFYHYAKKFKYAFAPSHIFSIQSNAIDKFWDRIKNDLKVAEEIKNEEFENMSNSQKEKFTSSLQILIVINKVIYFISSKLKRFQKSRLNVVYYFSSLIYTLFITIIIFAFQNFALYKIDYTAFNSPPKGNFFFFIYYSFNTLFTNSINDFYPTSDFARFLNSFETLFAFILLGILFFLLTTIVRDRHNDEINSAISQFKDKGEELEVVITEEYKMDVSQAIEFVESIQGNLIKIIYYFTENIDDDSV